MSLPQLQQRLHNYQGDVMVRYLNRLGLSTTLFLTVREGRAYQRFKAGTPPLDWAWLDQAIGHVPLLDGRLPQSHHALR
ncbi:hypothetical protein D3C80_1126330 [compost metagenome]